MNVLGFNFIKISAERAKRLENVKINTKIEFKDPTKEDSKLLNNQELFNFPFTYNIRYNSEDPKTKKEEAQASIVFEGIVLVSGTKEETKDIIKNWKSQESESSFKTGIINTIIHKCTVKALSIEEEINLPTHINLPRVKIDN